MEKQRDIIRSSLSDFVTSNLGCTDLSVVDDIVLTYVTSILEEVSDDPGFDVDGFVEMMTAFFPDFSGISTATICSWIFELDAELTALKKAQEDRNGATAIRSLSLSDMLPEPALATSPTSAAAASPVAAAAAAAAGAHGGQRRTQHLSETSDGGSTDSSSSCCTEFFTEECDKLQEMFPNSSYLEVKHCVGIANGDLDRATQMLLDRQDAGQSLTCPVGPHAPKNQVIGEGELKSRIIIRYSYVDKNEEAKEYKPVGPKHEPKKLVRYRDNKIVSLKGERYTDVRRDDDAELKKPKRPNNP